MKKISDVVVCFVIFVLMIGMDRVAPESRENSALLPFLKTRNQNERNVIMLTEQWKPIRGFEGLYEISNLGRVKALKREWLSGKNYNVTRTKDESIIHNRDKKSGYIDIILCKNGNPKTFRLHLLVWDNWGDSQRDGKKIQVDHIDGNKKNNRIDNLQLLSCQKNIAKYHDSRTDKTSSYVGVCWHKVSNRWQATFRGKYLGIYENEEDAALVYKNTLREYEIN